MIDTGSKGMFMVWGIDVAATEREIMPHYFR